MKLSVSNNSEFSWDSLHVVPVSDKIVSDLRKKPKTSFEKALHEIVKDKFFDDAKKPYYTGHLIDGKHFPLLLLGLGKEKELNLEKLRRSVAGVAGKAKDLSLEGISLHLPELEKFSAEETAKAFAEGLLLGSYVFDKYKTYSKETPKKEVKTASFIVSVKDSAKAKKVLEEVELVSENVFMVRDLQNDNANVVTPLKLVEVAKDLAK
ncbi:MAG: M17 family peptidase N-terminal domain-containing protein, partial [Candidatus Diapherotrites archaeon]|nr:M17 family peptidase N-terminal domain-containing protein [Candidatus Diapherotrites archaeon]